MPSSAPLVSTNAVSTAAELPGRTNLTDGSFIARPWERFRLRDPKFVCGACVPGAGHHSARGHGTAKPCSCGMVHCETVRAGVDCNCLVGTACIYFHQC